MSNGLYVDMDAQILALNEGASKMASQSETSQVNVTFWYDYI